MRGADLARAVDQPAAGGQPGDVDRAVGHARAPTKVPSSEVRPSSSRIVPSSLPERIAMRRRAGDARIAGGEVRLDPLRAIDRREGQRAVDPAAGQRQRAGEAAGIGRAGRRGPSSRRR